MKAQKVGSPRAALLVLVAVVLIPGRPAHAAVATFTNPVNSTGPDPYMTYYNGYYYLTTTPWNGPLTMSKAPTTAALKQAAPVAVFDGFPAGPYTYKGMVFGTNNWWGIDGSVVTIGGQLYFVWSGVPTQLWQDSDPHIYIAAMTTRGRSAASGPRSPRRPTGGRPRALTFGG